MFKEIILLSIICIAVSFPLSSLVNTYMTVQRIPYNSSISYIKFLPFLLLSTVVVYGGLQTKRLANNNQIKEAKRLVAILFALVFVAMFVISSTFGIGMRFYL
jgi:hypothetical protein